MGFGGILAAMAQGLGTGMVKVADEGWKKAADERKFKFYADESEKGRAHDLALNEKRFEQEKEMEGIKHKNRISEIAFSARQSAKNGSSPEKMFSNEFDSVLEAFNQNKSRIGEIDDQLKKPKGLSKDEIDKLKQQRSVLIGQNDRIANDDRIRNEVMSGKYGERMISSYNIAIEPLRKSPVTIQEPSMQPLPTVEEPKMINANDEGALKKAQDDIFSRKIQDMSRKQIEKYGDNPYLKFMQSHYNR
ncbi:hypothetical protein [Pasteurella multocida]|uniref:hypothetical protein n=1 Tax=Pasteurella multocida TaxID=747 RepID=UPI0008FABCF6|nr:hypothetical protein [Pasteurella multocida]MCL7793513.1 hypothetical protein [Pasteurella multocida]MDC4235936.1 hypothetical protein [Pasteurella multocida]PNW26055.1 hypothetical protein AP056_00405 [Pasteurella multocida subsp. multocida]HDR0725528.1 hypothetical protein [Pasteurella multocida]HDR0729792.1 hypothetical protein [Pasteurella multocida]